LQILFEQVSKLYRKKAAYGTLAASFQEIANRLRNGGIKNNDSFFWALKDVSFSVKQGDALGIIGPNGAGKTTILKMLAGITYPTSGKVTIEGRIAPLIQLGAGFHQELTARENIYLCGIILGLKRQEINKKFDSIVEFAELEQFLDMPMKKYSSGMHARLGFSIAIHTNPQILLIDEVLAVGDFAFQQKCLSRMNEFKRQGVTIVFVSHNLEHVRKLCPTVILLNKGHIEANGPADLVLGKYFDVYSESLVGAGEGRIKHAEITKARLLNSEGAEANCFKSGETARLKISARFNSDIKRPTFGFFVRCPDRLLVLSTPSSNLGAVIENCPAGTELEVEYEFKVNLLTGVYHIGTQITSESFDTFYDYIDKATTINVEDRHSHGGIADLEPKFRVVKSTQ